MTKLIHHSSLRMKKSKRYLFSFIHHSPFFILMRILYDITYSLLTKISGKITYAIKICGHLILNTILIRYNFYCFFQISILFTINKYAFLTLIEETVSCVCFCIISFIKAVIGCFRIMNFRFSP